jgi:hypothetical protein
MNWTAHYKDGAKFKQYNEDGSENKYQDIKREELIAFSLSEDNKLILAIHLEQNQRLIYRKRIHKTPGQPDVAITFAGWQMTVNGKNIQSIAYINLDGSIHMAGEWKNDHPWFYEPELLPFEK